MIILSSCLAEHNFSGVDTKDDRDEDSLGNEMHPLFVNLFLLVPQSNCTVFFLYYFCHILCAEYK